MLLDPHKDGAILPIPVAEYPTAYVEKIGDEIDALRVASPETHDSIGALLDALER